MKRGTVIHRPPPLFLTRKERKKRKTRIVKFVHIAWRPVRLKNQHQAGPRVKGMCSLNFRLPLFLIHCCFSLPSCIYVICLQITIILILFFHPFSSDRESPPPPPPPLLLILTLPCTKCFTSSFTASQRRRSMNCAWAGSGRPVNGRRPQRRSRRKLRLLKRPQK